MIPTVGARVAALDKKLKGRWSSTEIAHELEPDLVEGLLGDFDRRETPIKLRALLAFLALSEHKLRAVEADLSRILDKADTNMDDWVRVVAGLVREWLSMPKEGDGAAADAGSRMPQRTARDILQRAAERGGGKPAEAGNALPVVLETPYFYPMELPYLSKRLQPDAEVFRNMHFAPNLDALRGEVASDDFSAEAAGGALSAAAATATAMNALLPTQAVAAARTSAPSALADTSNRDEVAALSGNNGGKNSSEPAAAGNAAEPHRKSHGGPAEAAAGAAATPSATNALETTRRSQSASLGGLAGRGVVGNANAVPLLPGTAGLLYKKGIGASGAGLGLGRVGSARGGASAGLAAAPRPRAGAAAAATQRAGASKLKILDLDDVKQLRVKGASGSGFGRKQKAGAPPAPPAGGPGAAAAAALATLAEAASFASAHAPAVSAWAMPTASVVPSDAPATVMPAAVPAVPATQHQAMYAPPGALVPAAAFLTGAGAAAAAAGDGGGVSSGFAAAQAASQQAGVDFAAIANADERLRQVVVEYWDNLSAEDQQAVQAFLQLPGPAPGVPQRRIRLQEAVEEENGARFRVTHYLYLTYESRTWNKTRKSKRLKDSEGEHAGDAGA